MYFYIEHNNTIETFRQQNANTFVYFAYTEHLKEPFMVALQNDRLRMMPASFLPPSPVNKPGKP